MCMHNVLEGSNVQNMLLLNKSHCWMAMHRNVKVLDQTKKLLGKSSNKERRM